MTAGAIAALLLAADPRAQLEAVRSRRAQQEAASRELARREVSVLGALEDSQRAAIEAAALARRAEAERALGEGRLARARAEEGAAEGRFRAAQDELRPRLAARARLGRAGELRILAASPSFSELVRRRYLLDRVLARDAAVAAEARAAREVRSRTREAAEEEARRLVAAAAAASELRAAARRALERRRALLAAVRGERALLERAAAEAAGQERMLGEFIAALPPPRKGEAGYRGFGGLRGRLPRPVGGPVEIPFGRVVHPRFRTVTVQNGVELGAAGGEEVRAVAPGRVVHAGWFKGYGNLVIVDHGEGYHTLVAHLASMRTAMGEEVEAGALLGTAGDTGSLRGPSLYFEVRERGRPVDPAAWLAPRSDDILRR
ncbi:MAG TPA: peptidoglycan DD-metalloendopeptidase family protein [Anaeromyxobacteraceae bacterium]